MNAVAPGFDRHQDLTDVNFTNLAADDTERFDGTNFVNVKNNYSALVDPSISDNFASGYKVGSVWVNTTTDAVWVCMGDGVWHEDIVASASGSVTTQESLRVAAAASGSVTAILVRNSGNKGGDIAIDDARNRVTISPLMLISTLEIAYSGTNIEQRNDSALIFKSRESGADQVSFRFINNLNAGILEITREGLLNFPGTMTDSTKDPTTDAPDNWIQCRLDGVDGHVPWYQA